MGGTDLTTRVLDLPDAAATDRLGQSFAEHLTPGDVFLLAGQIGAGKSHLHERSSGRTGAGRNGEDMPSPSYTLVQTYPARVSGSCMRTCTGWASGGLVKPACETFSSGVALVEWPDRWRRPGRALTLRMWINSSGQARTVCLASPDFRGAGRWGAAWTR